MTVLTASRHSLSEAACDVKLQGSERWEMMLRGLVIKSSTRDNSDCLASASPVSSGLSDDTVSLRPSSSLWFFHSVYYSWILRLKKVNEICQFWCLERGSCAWWTHLLGTQRSWIMLFMPLPSWPPSLLLSINQEPFMCFTHWRDKKKLYLGHRAFQRGLFLPYIRRSVFEKAKILERGSRSDPGMSRLELDALPSQKSSCKAYVFWQISVSFLPILILGSSG